jgi:hypothetical protein
MIRAVLVGLAVSLAVSLGPERDADAQTVITGTVKSKAGQPLSGLALLEKGQIFNNKWDGGALVGEDGRFRIELSEGGEYGLHVYSSGYLYAPKSLKVETRKTIEVDMVLVPEPTRANDPVIKGVSFSGETVKMEVTDPNGILGPEVLAFNAATGRAFAMEPPGWVWSLKSNYPNGVYALKIDAKANPRDWHFVVADHKCYTTDILSFPHDPKPPRIVP